MISGTVSTFNIIGLRQVKFSSGFMLLNRKAELNQAFKPYFWICLITPPGMGTRWSALICTDPPLVTTSAAESTALASHRSAGTCTGALHEYQDLHGQACCWQQIELTCSWAHSKCWHAPYCYWLAHCIFLNLREGRGLFISHQIYYLKLCWFSQLYL